MIEWVLLAIALLLFWGFIILAKRRYHLEKRGFAISPGILMWRTKYGLEFIDRVGRSHKRGWRIFGNAATVVGFGLMVFMFVIIMLNAVIILTQPKIVSAAAGVRLVIPGVTIPLWEGLIAMFSLLIVHEFSHGFLLRAQGIPTKSVGGMVFIIIPGAFVEPDEKRLKKAPILQRLRVYGAGSFANILFALLCLAIILIVVVPRPGVYVLGTGENSPAENAGIQPSMRLFSINDIEMDTWQDFYDFTENIRPGENLSIMADEKLFTLTTTAREDNENRGFIGIAPISALPRSNFTNPLYTFAAISYGIMGRSLFHPYSDNALIPWPLVSVLTWMFLLNFAIGMFNLLPLVPLDGGYILQGVAERASSEQTAKRVSYIFSFIVLALIIVNFVPMFA